MSATSIEWTDDVWNPTRGCSRVSPGCEHCYAERQAARFRGQGQPYEGLVRTHPSGEPRWTGEVRLVPSVLTAPLRWRKPRRIFVNSMSDLFHESLTDEQIAAVFGVMAATPTHTYQILTKRAKRMAEWFDRMDGPIHRRSEEHPGRPWPLPNVWLGISAEDQQRLDERIQFLLRCSAAIRFLSIEPLIDEIGEIDLNGISWVIVGGESGPGARPCDVAWIRSIVVQCRAAGVACFTKQDSGPRPGRQGRIPDDLWIKEFPRGGAA